MTVGDKNTVQKGLYHKVGVPARENGLAGLAQGSLYVGFVHHREMGRWGNGDMGHLFSVMFLIT